jgi:Ca2+:H+ antiporter
MGVRKRLVWRVVPPLGLAVALAGSAVAGSGSASAAVAAAVSLVGLVVLVAAVFSSVHHADVIAHRVGEPYGTLVLTVAVTVIEVALILSIMLAGKGNQALARETVFSVIMVVCNGMVGLCLIVGGLRYGEQGFRLPGASAYLVVLMPLATLSLILPTYTTSVPGPFYTPTQLVFVGVATLLLYGVFLYVQTVRHRDYFLSDMGDAHDNEPPDETVAAWRFWESVVLLVVALAAVVLLAKGFAGSVEAAVIAVGAPLEAVGLLVALLVLMPETLAALRAARRNELQKSLNLALGSSLATIGLTIPAVSVLALVLEQPLALGVDLRDTILLVLTFAVSLVTFGGGRTNILPGFVHLVLFVTFVFLIFVP